MSGASGAGGGPVQAGTSAADAAEASAATAAYVVEELVRRGLTIATAESLTGGLVCAALTDVPGASATVRGGVVSYATDIKASVLGVDPGLLRARGPVDPDVAVAMAMGVAQRLGADVAVSTTGVAGPGPSDGVPAGTVFVAVVWGGDGARPGPDGQVLVEVRRLYLVGPRAVIRAGTVAATLELIAELLRGSAGAAAAPAGAGQAGAGRPASGPRGRRSAGAGRPASGSCGHRSAAVGRPASGSRGRSPDVGRNR